MPFILFFVLLFSGLSSAQTWQMPAKQIYVDNSTFTNINYSTNVPASLQTTLSYVDSNWVGSADFFQLESELDALNVDFTNAIFGIDTRLNVGEINTNFNIINLNFSIISQDFRNAYAYLLGGTQVVFSSVTTNFNLNTNIINGITNLYVEASYVLVPSQTNVFLTDGSTTNGALVPVLQYNQDITKTNFIGVNQNTYFTTNLFSIVGSLLGLTNQPYVSDGTYSNFVTWLNSFVQMNTNYVDLPVGLTFNFPNLFTPVKTDIGIVSNYVGTTANQIYGYIDTRLDSGPIITNALLANLNFSIISQDFRNAYAYLLGGTQATYYGWTTNYVTRQEVVGTITSTVVDTFYNLVPSGFITNSVVGSADNAALVPKLQYNQDITKTNFIGVNQNTYLTTNMLSIVGKLLGLTNNVGVSVDYNRWITNFVQMNTNYGALPTDLSFNFPNLIQPLSTEIGIVSNYVGVVSNNIIGYIDTRLDQGPIVTNALLANLNFSIISQDFRNAYAYLLGGTQQQYSGFTTSYVTKTEVIGTITNQYVEAVYSLTTTGTLINTINGSDESSALIPRLQYNQDITKTNFIGVNQNTYFTTNMFKIVGQLLGLTNTTGISTSYNNWASSFVQMNTNYGALPTDLTFSFPSLIQELETEIGIVSNYAGTASTGVISYVDGFYVSKQLFYDTLNQLGFANYDAYTFYSDAVYGSSSAPPNNNGAFLTQEQTYWTVPPINIVNTGQTINVHLWGAGGVGNSLGGYTYGEFLVVDPNDFTSSVPWMVTNGMKIIVQVGNTKNGAGRRAAIWRGSGSDFASWTNELLVAGGGGNFGLATGNGGGNGGGVNGLNAPSFSGLSGGTGGSQIGGGVTGGSRVWGALGYYYSQNLAYYGGGGDGYFGGGKGALGTATAVEGYTYPISAGGGGGSGFVAPNWNGQTELYSTNILVSFTTNALAGASQPPGTFETSYGLNAGYPSNPGRVTFEIKFNTFGQ